MRLHTSNEIATRLQYEIAYEIFQQFQGLEIKSKTILQSTFDKFVLNFKLVQN